MKVDIEYRVPVMVTVDTETGEVERVRVYDETIAGPHDAYNEAGESLVGTTEPGRDALGNALSHAAKARDIAESEEWPAWEIG